MEIIIACDDGTYELRIFDTLSGDITEERVVETSNGKLVLFFNRIHQDLAFILKKQS